MAAAAVPLLKKITSPIHIPSAEGNLISKNPNLEIAQLCFEINHKDTNLSEKAEKLKVLLQHFKDNEMGPFYELLTSELQLPVDKALLTELKQKNTKKIQEIDAEILNAKRNFGEKEVRQAFLKKSEYLCQIGDKNAAVSASSNISKEISDRKFKLDLVFNLIHLGFFLHDLKLIDVKISEAKLLIRFYDDRECKNRLRSYEGFYKMATRDFKGATALFLEAVPNFESNEFLSYEDLVFYTVLSAVYSLDRNQFYKKVMSCKNIKEQLGVGGEKGDLIPIRQYVDAFYNCTYDQFFIMLAQLESQRLKFDRYLAPHYAFYSRAMRLKAYEQHLTPYKAVEIQTVAKDFGVSSEVIRQEVAYLIIQKKLKFKINNGKIEENLDNQKRDWYQIRNRFLRFFIVGIIIGFAVIMCFDCIRMLQQQS